MKRLPLMDRKSVQERQQHVHSVFSNTDPELLEKVIRACSKIDRSDMEGTVEMDKFTAKMMGVCLMLELSRWVDKQMDEHGVTTEEVDE